MAKVNEMNFDIREMSTRKKVIELIFKVSRTAVDYIISQYKEMHSSQYKLENEGGYYENIVTEDEAIF